MAEAPDEQYPSFRIDKKQRDPDWQPLELYHLAHDLRGPLNSILGFTELLIEGIEGPLNETQQADLAAIFQSARNLLHLINTTVDLSKMEAGRLNLTMAAVDLSQVLGLVLESDVVTGRPDGVNFETQIPAALPAVWGDAERVEQMILSFIRFSLRMQKKGRLNLTVVSGGDQVTVQVTAGGVVIPAEELPELFELVVKTDPSGRSELGLGGLGLPLTRQLAEKHGGRAWAESRADSGTTFYLRLPVHNEP